MRSLGPDGGLFEPREPTLKEATIKASQYDTIEQFKPHLHDFLMAYIFALKLKSLLFIVPYEIIIVEK